MGDIIIPVEYRHSRYSKPPRILQFAIIIGSSLHAVFLISLVTYRLFRVPIKLRRFISRAVSPFPSAGSIPGEVEFRSGSICEVKSSARTGVFPPNLLVIAPILRTLFFRISTTEHDRRQYSALEFVSNL